MSRKGYKAPIGADISQGALRAIAQSFQKGDFLRAQDLQWIPFDMVPIANRQLTINTPSIYFAKYIYVPQVKICFISFQLFFTTGATAANRGWFSLPVAGMPTLTQNQRVNLWINDGGAQQPGIGIIGAGEAALGFQNVGLTNIAINATIVLAGNFFYMTI